ncbi:MAG: DUF4362 domain-containing protein [Candidatus Gastranaerophilales bacterium]|nr:DUF4362 domain-containing protein [Candidatus Gastranaerophilales bacterium]
MWRKRSAITWVLLAAFVLGGCENLDSGKGIGGILQEENSSAGEGREIVSEGTEGILEGIGIFSAESGVSSEGMDERSEDLDLSMKSTESVKTMGGTHDKDLTLGRDGESIKAYLSAFSNELADYEATEECFVLLHGDVAYGQENWDRFVDSANQGTPAYVILVQFTVEGDAILQYLEYDGMDFYRFSDYSRDAFGGTGNRYFEETYAYLRSLPCHDTQGNEYSYVFLTDSDDITMTEIEYYQYVGVYRDCADAVPDLFFLFEIMVKEREKNAPVAQPEKVFEVEVNQLADVTMELLYATPVSIGVEFKNDSDLEVTYGESYDLQVLQDGKWYSLSYVIDHAAFNMLGYLLHGGKNRIWGTDWTIFHGVLGDGQYRLVKSVSVEENGGFQNYYLAAEFEID